MAGKAMGIHRIDAKVMSTMKRFAITLTIAAACLAGSGMQGVSSRAHAQDVQVQGPLAGAPAVIGLRVYREMRFSIQLHATMTLQDEFSRAIFTGGQLMFHFTDWLGVGIWGGYAAGNIDSSLSDQIVQKGQTNAVNVLSLPNAKNFTNQIGRMKWIAAPQVTFIPLRGKLGIFEKLFVDTDFYVFGGVAFVGLEERANVDADFTRGCLTMGDNGGLAAAIRCLGDTQGARSSRMAIAPTFGAGLSLFLADFVSMSLEWRAMPFAWNTSGTDESGSPRGDFPDKQINESDRLSHFNHMLTLGFGFYLPTKPKISSVDN
jgi:outer membrane beta-barrel protein